MDTVYEKAMIVRNELEHELGITFPDDMVDEVFESCKRKCRCAKKDIDYLPIMFRTELPIRLMVSVINICGELNHRAKEATRNVRDMQMSTVLTGVS